MNASVNVIGRCKIEKSAADRHILMKRLNFSSNLLKIIPLNIASSAIAVNRVIPIMNKSFLCPCSFKIISRGTSKQFPGTKKGDI